MTVYGYARVSTGEQNTAMQIDALKAAGCTRIFQDEGISGTMTSRPALDDCLNTLQSGDTLVLWRLDRLGRSLLHLIETVKALGDRGIGVKSLTQDIDTTSRQGKLFFHIVAVLAEYERDQIAERTKAGLDAAKRRGVQLGRGDAITAEQLAAAAAMKAAGKTYSEIGPIIGKRPNSVRKALKRRGLDIIPRP